MQAVMRVPGGGDHHGACADDAIGRSQQVFPADRPPIDHGAAGVHLCAVGTGDAHVSKGQLQWMNRDTDGFDQGAEGFFVFDVFFV